MSTRDPAEVPDHPLLQGLLGRPLDRVGGCQSYPGPHTPLSAPWRGTDREDEKTRLYQYVANPGGETQRTPLPKIVRDLFDLESVAEDPAARRRAERFYDRYPEWFRVGKTDRQDGFLYVEPTAKACRYASLDTASKHTVEKAGESQEGDGVALSNAKVTLGNRQTIVDDEVRGDLLGSFGAKRAATADRFHAFEDSFSFLPPRLIPLSTRFNSGRRVAETRDRYGTAYDRGKEVGPNPGTATVVTATSDPANYDSLLDAAEGLLDDVNLLKKRVFSSAESRPTRIGDRVPTLVVPEFTEKGVPHVHIVFFGVGWVARHSALSRYWSEKRERGEVVWFDRLQVRGGRWRWAKSEEDRDHPDTRGRTPRAYLREGIDLLSRSADASAAEVRDAANALRAAGRTDVEEAGDADLDGDALDRGRDLWKAALYWSTGLSVFTASPELKSVSDDGDGRATAPDGTPLPRDAPPRWEYIGTARLGEFPPSLRETATIVTRGPGPPIPPDASDPPSTGATSSTPRTA